ncbi:hypothetical protein RCH19_002143 [Flavobacterium sp. PL12]
MNSIKVHVTLFYDYRIFLAKKKTIIYYFFVKTRLINKFSQKKSLIY